ncbi:MAG: hypothetical protein CO108_01310 [Deltaproteobacteria bacterium CG_4_9_14_3_um_filter_63_12]|nr:MAG: hypothetical protein CO108_01310 [Deltaproteobacteria bacterium CG_4_9_14_3_um_filter_63_12]
MSTREQHELLARTHQELAQSEDPARQVGWRCQASQRLRFAVCAESVDLRQVESVLDVGCGLGDLAPFLRARGFKGRYLGIDVLPAMVRGAQDRHPDEQFRATDVVELVGNSEVFDLTVICGSFNLMAGRRLETFRAQLDAAWFLTQGTLVLVVVDRRWPRASMDPDLLSFDLKSLGAECRRLSPVFSLRCGFLPSDIAATVHRGATPTVHRLVESGAIDEVEAATLCMEMSLAGPALGFLASVPESRRDTVYWLRRGQAQRALGNDGAALQFLREALSADPHNTEASLELEALGEVEGK